MKTLPRVSSILAVTLGLLFTAHLSALVVDEVGLLNPSQQAGLNSLTSDGSIAIHIAASTNGHSIKAFSDAWAARSRTSDPALDVVITVVPSQHQLYISTAHTIHGKFSSQDAGQVIQGILVPSFKAGDWNGGLTQAVHAIQAHLGTQTTTSTQSASTPYSPSTQNNSDGANAIWIFFGLFAVVLLGFLIIAPQWRRFKHFEFVVSSGRPEFVLYPEVEAQEKVRDALEMLQDLHNALPLGLNKRLAFYRRRKDDFQAAYQTCKMAQELAEEQARRAAEAQQRFEQLKANSGSLSPAEQERLAALEAQYRSSGYNSSFLLENLVLMDLWSHAFQPQNVFIENNTFIDNNSFTDDDDLRQGSWNDNSGGWDGSGGDFGGGDSGGFGGDGGSW